MAKRPAAWADVFASGADVAMLQEIANPNGIEHPIRVDGEPWQNQVVHHEHVWRNAVAALRDDVQIRWFKPHIAEVIPARGEPLIVMSLYAMWQKPNAATGSSWIYADASAHRLISDLSAFIGSVRGHRIIAAGDLNIFHGYGDKGSPYWTDTIATATHQLDYVFASESIADRISVRALNGIEEWGKSDHARVVVEVGE